MMREDDMMDSTYFTEQTEFFGGQRPHELIAEFGSPLYVYNETILRTRCREMARLISLPGFKVNYSCKANSNITLLRIIQEEGLDADAMSPGEIYLLRAAGFPPERIFYVGNNVAASEIQAVVDQGIRVSVDSLSQLERFGKINPGGRVAVRFNPGIGTGHHEKVVTAGQHTKFGVAPDLIPEVKQILEEYHLRLAGINQHIGSLFMNPGAYLKATEALLEIAVKFNGLEFIDLGGGFGIPYRKQSGETRLDLDQLGRELNLRLNRWLEAYDLGDHMNKPTFKIEPGRYVSAEAGMLLGTVHAIKQNYDTVYVGTDLGFNLLSRPILYDAYHEVEVYNGKTGLVKKENAQTVTVVGNICETGDIIAKARSLPRIGEGDLLGIMDAGAYGFSMSSNYNNRLRPAEVLIKENGAPLLIRRRETEADLMRCFVNSED
jgi:diaminopimelate decarboxylase